MPDTDLIGIADTGDNVEKQVPKEQITEIVDKFSQLYEVDLHDASCDFEVDYISRDEWNRKLLQMEVSSVYGTSVTISEADRKNIAEGREIPRGEWIQSEGKGYLLEMSEKEYPKICQDHILKHEIMHAISRRTGAGFSRRSIFQNIFDEGGIYDENRKNLDEGATEVLALGVSLNTTDIEEIGKVVRQRYEAIKNSKLEHKEISDMKAYIEESMKVLEVLKMTGITVKEMASYYSKGDFKGFSERLIDTFNNKYPKERRIEDENLYFYSKFEDCMNYLGMGIEFFYSNHKIDNPLQNGE